MDRILTIDQGNSRVKCVLYAGMEPVKTIRIDGCPVRELAELAESERPDGVVYASVGCSGKEAVETLRGIKDLKVLAVDSRTPVPVKILYKSPQTLGADRIAAAAGAEGLFSGEQLTIADSGTALTIDVVTSGGEYLGGNISAGVRMRLRSLHEHTALLPTVSAEGELPPFGTDTETALRCGAVRGVAAEIATMAIVTAAQRIVLTGGDAPIIERALNEISTIPVATVTDLVARGLLHIFYYNERT